MGETRPVQPLQDAGANTLPCVRACLPRRHTQVRASGAAEDGTPGTVAGTPVKGTTSSPFVELVPAGAGGMPAPILTPDIRGSRGFLHILGCVLLPEIPARLLGGVGGSGGAA